VAMEPLNEEQQAFVDKLVGEARVKARKLAQEEATKAAATSAEGGDAGEAAILKRIADAEVTARTAAKEGFDADAVAAATKAEEDAATAKLVEEKKWEDLATQHSTKVEELTAELDPLKVSITAYEALVADMLEGALETLGEVAKKAVEAMPGEPSTLEKLVWLHQNEELFESEDPKSGAYGTPSAKAKAKKKVAKKGDASDDEAPVPGRINRWPLNL